MFAHWYSGMGIGGWIAMTVLWVGLISAVIWAIDKLLPSSRSVADHARLSGEGTAQDILDRRLAAGEIDTDTHRRLLATLSTRAPR